ncbi:PAS domain S-box protein [Emticicia aquatica]|nr:PAS domain S-box protein [Emticicia aquatica]
MKNSYSKYSHLHVNNIEDLSKHHFRYILYFWAVGIFVPASELCIEIFKVREKSDLIANLVIGAICLGIGFGSRYSDFLKRNLHHFFLGFFITYNLLIIYKIAYAPMDFLNLAEFSIINMTSYYVFYNAKNFYIYFSSINAILLTFVFSKLISAKDYIIYFNSSFISFTINYVIHFIDLSTKENLFFAYNFVNKGNLLVIGIDNEGTITFVSDNVKETLGYDKEEWIGKNWNADIAKDIETTIIDGVETQKMKVKNGDYKFLDWHEEVFNDSLSLKVGRDISEIKQSETQLRRTNSRLNSLLSNIGDLVFVIDTNYFFKEYYQSENENDLLLPASAFIGKTIFDIGFPEDALNAIKVAVDTTIKTNKKSSAEYALTLPHGKQWFNVVVSTLSDEEGTPIEVICIARNITESKLSEIELKRTKETLEQTNRVALVGGWEFDIKEQKLRTSDITKSIYEVSADTTSDFQGAIQYFKEGENRDAIKKALDDCIKLGIPYDLELEIITAKGNSRWVRAKGAAEFVNNQCSRIYGTVQDIEEQVNAKNALIQSEEKLRFISNNISDVVIVFEKDKVVYLSPAHEKQFGYSAEEAISIAENNIFDFFHPDDHQLLDDVYGQAIQKQMPSLTYISRFLHKNGHYVWREDSVNLIYDKDGSPLMRIVSARDISERKAAEIAKQQRQERRLLQNTILLGISTTPYDESGFWEKGIQTITEAAANGIGVSRVSIWTYTKDQIESVDLFNRESSQHSSGEVIIASQFPTYFEGLKKGLAIVASDALTHKYTRELAESYLKPLSIKSILDVPVRVNGKLEGVICWEQTNEAKIWTEEDISFARSIADIISLGIEADKRRKAEAELNQTKEILEQTSIIARIGSWEIDLINKDFYLSDINKVILEAPLSFKLELDDALNYYKEGESRDKIASAIYKCIKDGTSFDIEVQIITLNGTEKWVRAIGQAEFSQGQCKRLYGTFQDIDEQVQLNQIVRDKEQQYRTLIANISTVTFRCLNDEHWTMIFISDAIKHLTGYDASDFINNQVRSYISIVHPDDKSFAALPFVGNLLEEYSIEYRILDINNNIIWVNEKGTRYFDENENRFLLDGIITNITERKTTEIAIKKSYEDLKNAQGKLLEIQLEQEKFVNLIKYSDAFIALSDMKGNVIFLNEKAKNMSGFGDSYQQTTAFQYHTDKSANLLRNVVIPYIFKDGMWKGELDIVHSKTKEIRYTDATVFLIKDPLTEKAFTVATIQIDITERKKAEEKLIENQHLLLYKSEILAAIAKTTEKLLISKNIKETLKETFRLIGEAVNVDRVYFFENDLKTNLISQSVEWVKDSISSQMNNPLTHNLSFEDISFYTEPLLQNKIFQKTFSGLNNPKITKRWESQSILSALLLPIFIKNQFHGFIGFDDCTNEQIWSEEKINILQSLATNIANAFERIKNEAIIEESEGNFRQLTETIQDVFLLYDVVNDKCLYVSPSCKKVLEADQEYFYTQNNYIQDFLSEEYQTFGFTILGKLRQDNIAEGEFIIKTKDNQEKWIQQKAFGIRNKSGELVRISSVFTDITERKLIQNQIKQLSIVAEKITTGVLIADIEGRVIWANQGFLEMLEIPLEELINKRPRNLFNPQNRELNDQIDIMNGYNFTLELEVETYKKNKKWIEVNNTVIKDDEGVIIQQVEVVTDITERKKVEKKLVEERKLLRAIIDNIPINIYVKDRSAKKILSNKTDVNYAGYKEESDVIGKMDFDLYDAKSAQESFDLDMEVMSSKQAKIAFESLHKRKNGDISWLLISKIPLKNELDEVTSMVGISIDITERKKSQQLLQESQQKLTGILNSLDEVVWAISVPDYKLLFVSKSFEKVYGKTAREWRRNFNIWKEAIHPEDRVIAEKIEHDVINYGTAHGIYRIIDAHGNLKWLENATKMVKNEKDKAFMIIGITTDITDKKIAEQALIKANKLTEAANKSKAELELRALQMQMNPHFVFNALNSIQSYVMNQDTFTANSYLSKFARLIRLFLDSSRSKFITLAEEINLLTLYIELENIRFDNKFDFEITIEPNVSKYIEIPTMILQPFVENAINHGLRYKLTKGFLSIRFYSELGYLICKIEDNGVGRKNAERIQTKSSKGYQSQGLKITAERLLAYNKINDANIVFSVNDKIRNAEDPNAEVGTVIEIRFPEN